MERIEVPLHLPKKERLEFLMKNKEAIMQQKKMLGKAADGFSFSVAKVLPDFVTGIFDSAGKTVMNVKVKPVYGSLTGKASSPQLTGEVINVKAIINTTNWMDSHQDVHIPGLWKKSLAENKKIMHLQEHNMSFDHIISSGDDLRVSTKKVTWKSLGYDYEGSTEALIFDSDVRKSRNEYMYDQYLKGYVDNHSVWMRYIKIVLCVNEPDNTAWGAEFEAWEKYIPEVVNKDHAEEIGHFWAVLEAKTIEGSAVPMGSNIITPTLSVTSKGEPLKNTRTKAEPAQATQKFLQLLKTKNIFE